MTLLAADDLASRLAAIVVTYNSAATLPRLLQSILDSTVGVRVIVVDNGSVDDSVSVARALTGIVVVATGANLGYSGGINVGRRFVRDGEAVVILNPDLELARDALERMQAVLDDATVGIVAPQLHELSSGERFESLRREPSVLGALGDGVFGNRWKSRPRVLAETMRRDGEYAVEHDVAWAGGAALLVSAACNRSVGEWDADAYFLYSEETDYARRARDLGFVVRFTPEAVAYHQGSGSGQPAALVALISVNRVRYYQQRHGRAATAAFRAAIAVQHALRLHDPRHRYSLRFVLRRSQWHRLPAGDPTPVGLTAHPSASVQQETA